MKYLLVFLFFCLSQILSAQPKIEIRAAWLTVNYGLDWPKKPFKTKNDIEIQKNELNRILDRLKDININMVFLQTRIRGDVIYPSKIEPFCEYVRSVYATTGYDPLQYAVEACHKRGIECHSWFVVYPMGSETRSKKLNRTFADLKRKNLIKSFKNSLYLDPGNPQTDEYLLSLVKELVSNYDIDGIHFDYIRYPDAPATFPDNENFKRYGQGKNKSDWRRENINCFVYKSYDLVKSLKPWVQVSSSVIGMYKEILGNNRRHWTAFNSVFQDPVDWLRKEKHDFIVPMNFYSDALFYPFVRDWASNIKNRYIVSGLGVYRMDPKESHWSASMLYDQVNFSRELKIQGNAFFRTTHLLDKTYGFGNGLYTRFYSSPALLPPLSWMSTSTPDVPSAPLVYIKDSFLHLEWQKLAIKNGQQIFYNLYRSKSIPVDINNPKNLIAIRIENNYYQLPVENRNESGYYYVITCFDRYHNESAGSEPVYFSQSRRVSRIRAK